jgi:hypothetical protein
VTSWWRGNSAASDSRIRFRSTITVPDSPPFSRATFRQESQSQAMKPSPWPTGMGECSGSFRARISAAMFVAIALARSGLV